MTEALVPAHVESTSLAGNIGAEIIGVHIGERISEEVIAGIREILLRHKVVFLRDQELDYVRLVAFAQRFGHLTLGHPIYATLPDRPFLREMDSQHGSRANHWHTDLTFLDRPPAFAFLHGVIIPPVGGDTIWANTVAAYASLSEELRELADRLRIVHSNDSDYTHATVGTRRDYLVTAYEAEHPAVVVHPDTGERSLLLGGFARYVVGLGPQASRDLIRLLQDHVTRPEHTVRWKWRAGDVAIWDNLATQHYAIYDYGSQHRRGERVTVAGSVPVGIDDRQSVALSGDATAYYAD